MKPSKKSATSFKTKKHKPLKRDATAPKGAKRKKSSSVPMIEKDRALKSTNVEIKPAKGRPMLTWVGKKPLRSAISYPVQLVESFNLESKFNNKEPWPDWPKSFPQAGLLFHGDNKDVLSTLLACGFREKIKLIYIDPPFDSGADYIRKVEIRGQKHIKIQGQSYEIGEQIQYTDIWTNDSYLQFIYERLMLLKELLSIDGSIFFHCDWHRGHMLRCLLDEIFSSDSFRNEIIWRYSKYQMRGMSRFVNNHDILYWYGKGNDTTYSPITEKLDKPKLLKRKKWDKESRKIVNVRDKEGNLIYDQYDESKVDDVWEIDIIGATSGERSFYPTQKPENLLERIISTASKPQDFILDCFIGSGTTAVVAQKLGRRWIGADINKGAIQTTINRLSGVIQDQSKTQKGKTQSLPGMENEESLIPAQLGFSVYRVNDYDLHIQHNEAFNLAVEHLGMTRTKTDSFFDGTLGKKLIKITPFNHPITVLDLEEIRNELKNRPSEERDIVAVGLGKELAVEAWLTDWNKLRKQGNVPNKIEIIELRTDPKYGGFFTHEPAKAKVSFNRQGEKVEISIEDFISPTILERLRQQNKDNPLFQPQITDWRSMVDSVMIDTDYNGESFNISVADVPEKKNDLVQGKYLVNTEKASTIAVKITDMLGEEILTIKKI